MIHIIIGTKAQLVKMAPVMVNLTKRNIPFNFIYTGQHRETIEEMIEDFGVRNPDVILYNGPDITSVFSMVSWGFRILCAAAIKRKNIFLGDEKGIVLVHGDTFSTLLGALMGRMAHLKIGHVESGLRSRNLFHPFPEEIIRILTIRLSHVLFCPGYWAIMNVASLKKEKVNTQGNTIYDTFFLTTNAHARTDHIPDHPFVVVSLHRYENVFQREVFCNIIKLLEVMSLKHKLLFILHPPTEKQLHRFDLYERLVANDNISLRPRYHHSDFIFLLKKCEFVVTDGGSLQEECFYLGIPCLLFRKKTEREEGVGKNVILSNYKANIVKKFCDSYLLHKREVVYLNISPSRIIVDELVKYV